MAKRCPEEFNPWPPFVDIFASVILVMLLFLLITIVNIGYYAQFKHKVSYTASVETQLPVQPEEQTKITTNLKECQPIEPKEPPKVNEITFHKVTAPDFEQEANSFFSGGKAEGNAVSYAVNKEQKEFTKQRATKRDLLLSIDFEDKEIFLNSQIKRTIRMFVSDINRRSKRTIYTLYVSDPKNMISSTIAKQISLGRILNVKHLVKRTNVNAKNIKMDLQHETESDNPYGNITIKAFIP